MKTEALARLGELLDKMPKAKGGAELGIGRRGKNAVPEENRIPTYADLHLTKKTAMIAQQLAALSLETREAIARRETTLTEAQRQERQRECPPSRAPSPSQTETLPPRPALDARPAKG